jgi:hypothetical protein
MCASRSCPATSRCLPAVPWFAEWHGTNDYVLNNSNSLWMLPCTYELAAALAYCVQSDCSVSVWFGLRCCHSHAGVPCCGLYTSLAKDCLNR